MIFCLQLINFYIQGLIFFPESTVSYMKFFDLMTMCIQYVYVLSFASLTCTMFICKSFLCHGHMQFTTSTYVLYHLLQVIEVCETSSSEQSFNDDCPSASSGH